MTEEFARPLTWGSFLAILTSETKRQYFATARYLSIIHASRRRQYLVPAGYNLGILCLGSRHESGRWASPSW